MKLITRKSNAIEALQIWRTNPCWSHLKEKVSHITGEPDPDELDAIAGNTSWTITKCSECGAKTDVVQLGEEPDYERETAYICKKCLEEALKLFEEKNTNGK